MEQFFWFLVLLAILVGVWWYCKKREVPAEPEDFQATEGQPSTQDTGGGPGPKTPV